MVRGTYNFQKDISGCGLSGIMDTSGKRFSGADILRSIAVLHDRGNGLGGGFAGYGIYPEYKDYYAFHMLLDDERAKEKCEDFIETHFIVKHAEPIPTRDPKEIYPLKHSGKSLEEMPVPIEPPLLWRYFVTPAERKVSDSGMSEKDYVVSTVMEINERLDGVFVVSSGKNMGAFKGVGYPEDIGHFFKIDEYEGNIWTAHARFPTNSPGWWGGAHPFTLLDWAVVHNGEVSSYGINKRYVEMYGYKCTLFTDTEVVTYILDLLIRRHGLPIETALKVMASPFWKNIDRMEDEERKLYETLRMTYGSALVNGPFAIIFSWSGGMACLNDRIKLRPLVVAKNGDMMYMSSEECGIREICPDPERIWNPKAGEPVIAVMKSKEALVSA